MLVQKCVPVVPPTWQYGGDYLDQADGKEHDMREGLNHIETTGLPCEKYIHNLNESIFVYSKAAISDHETITDAR